MRALPPIKHLAEDVKAKALERKASNPSGQKQNLARDEMELNRAQDIITRQTERMKVELDALKAEIKVIEQKAMPAEYVINLRADVRHRILSAMEVAGIEAKTFCGWHYVKFRGRVLREPPTKKAECCDTCRPQLKARLD